MDYPVKTPEQLEQVLRALRKDKGLTQTQAGRRAGLRQGAVSTLESAPGKASVERLFRVLSALGVELVLRDPDAAAKPAIGARSRRTDAPEW
jgi:HTH-type transcriptional regulator / antitoxin HipB